MNKISLVALILIIIFTFGAGFYAFGEAANDTYLPGGFLLDDTVYCCGIVTVGSEIFYAGAGRAFYMQNSEVVPNSGVYAYCSSPALIPVLVPGDSVCFEAVLIPANYDPPYDWPPMHVIIPGTFELVSSGNPVPEPTLITGEFLDSTGNADSLAAPYIFCRARVNNVTVDSVIAYSSTSTWICHDPSGHQFCVREASDSINFLPWVGVQFDFVQGVIYYRYDAFSLQPAYMSDLSFANPGTDFWIEPENPVVGDSVCLYCRVSEDLDIVGAYLSHRVNLEPFERDTMTQLNDTLYLYVFPPVDVVTRADFWLELEDGQGHIRKFPPDAPFNFYSFFWNEIISINDDPSSLPQVTELFQNYPNPFNAKTTIAFEIAKPGRFTLKIIDLLGREIQTLSDGYYYPGQYEVEFDASKLTSGIYFYRLNAEGYTFSRQMLLLK